jgi:hypothetical protein
LWMTPRWNGGRAEKIQMPRDKRRSLRREAELPIRIYGTDFQGKDFVEDSTTLVVSPHGAKIQLTHPLMPEQEIRILCQGNNREALFRVVRQAGEPMGEVSFWGVECLKAGENIWEGASPRPARKPEPKPIPKPIPKPSAIPSPKPIPKPSAILSPKPSPKPILKPSAKPSPKPAPRPRPQPDSQPSVQVKSPVQVMLRCSECGMRELVQIDETQFQAIRKLKGLVRGCPACGATGLWKRVAV